MAQVNAATSEKLSSKIIRLILSRLVFIIPTMIITWLIHTYVIVVMNEGFGDSTVWGKWVNTVGNTPSAMVVWGLLSAMIWSFIYSCFKFGPVRTASSFIKAPFWIYRSVTGSGKTGFGAFLMGVGLAAILSSIFQLKASANIVLGLALSLVGLSQPGFLLATFFAKGWMQIAGNLSKNQPDKYALSFRGAHLLVVGLSPGFICAAILSASFAQIFGIISLIVGIILFFNIKAPKTSAGQVSGLLIFGSFVTLLYIWLMDKAFADDGGAKECGNTFQSWSKCQGSAMAVARGAPPAIASGIGTLAPPINIIDPGKIPLTMSASDLTLRPGEDFYGGGPQEFQLPGRQLTQDDFDNARGYHVNPDGSVTVIGYQPGLTDYLVSILTGAQVGCDIGVSTLQNMTGTPGKIVGYTYIGLKNIGKDVSKAIAEGRPISEGLAQGVFDAGVDAAVSYGSDSVFSKIGLSGEAPDLSQASVTNIYKVATGQAGREEIKDIGINVTTTQVSGKTVKNFVWNSTVGGDAPSAVAHTGKSLLTPVLNSSLSGGVAGKAVDAAVTDTAQNYGWNALTSGPSSSSGPAPGAGWSPTDQLDR